MQVTFDRPAAGDVVFRPEPLSLRLKSPRSFFVASSGTHPLVNCCLAEVCLDVCLSGPIVHSEIRNQIYIKVNQPELTDRQLWEVAQNE
jgi:hypothetical protein